MIRFCVIGLVLMLTSCTSLQVSTDYNPNRDFSPLKSYAWLNEMDHPSDDVRINNEFVRQSVRTSVDKHLGAKGFVLAERDQADFLVTWFGGIEQKLKVETMNHFYAPYGYGTLYRDPYWNSQAGITETTEYEEGMLIFDFLDPKNNSLIWRGSGRDRIEEGNPEEVVKRNIDQAVKQILAGFPPR